MIKQPDLVPTLSRLAGVPIPINNIGVVIKKIANAFLSNEIESSEKLITYFYNALQVSKLFENGIQEGMFDIFIFNLSLYDLQLFQKFLDAGFKSFQALKDGVDGYSTSDNQQLADEFHLLAEMMSQSLEKNKLHYKVGEMLGGIGILLIVSFYTFKQ